MSSPPLRQLTSDLSLCLPPSLFELGDVVKGLSVRWTLRNFFSVNFMFTSKIVAVVERKFLRKEAIYREKDGFNGGGFYNHSGWLIEDVVVYRFMHSTHARTVAECRVYLQHVERSKYSTEFIKDLNHERREMIRPVFRS